MLCFNTVFMSMCVCTCVCVFVCHLTVLLKMLSILPEVNINLLIRSSTCYCIYSDNTKRFFIRIFPPKGVHWHESHHCTCKTLYSPAASKRPKRHQSALLWKLGRFVNVVRCFRYLHIAQCLMKQLPFKSHLDGVQPPGRARGRHIHLLTSGHGHSSSLTSLALGSLDMNF